MPLLLGVLALGMIFFGSQALRNSNRLFGLPDTTPENQGGTFKRTYDHYFLKAADSTGVPFALLKAHAIVESSLNPNAYLDESGGRVDRPGWASRGLMQILWWPKSERWKKYGYPDSKLGADGALMFDPTINTEIAAKLIRDNLNGCKGNVRDAINMYNTGKKESEFRAPHGYVDKVLGHYETLVKGNVA